MLTPKLTRAEKLERLALLEEKHRRQKSRVIYSMYPETGALSRHNYPKHMNFFKAGAKFQERAAICGNRIGKTWGMGGYELVLHLTGKYPHWWVGRRFTSAPKCWAAGTTNQKTKEILQEKFLGPLSDVGSGLIPGDLIVDYKRKASSVPDVVETVYVKHFSGDVSVLSFKSFEQGRAAFEGTEQDVILLDEECPHDVYEECCVRTMTTHGIIMLTFTPLQGVSEVVMLFMPGGVPVEGEINGRHLITATWDDAPHLTPEMKKKLWNSLKPHQREARSKGIPSLGSGAIYPIRESDILVDDFQVPIYWPQGYGFDVGWKATAAQWGAYDRENDIVYLTGSYKKGESEPIVHVNAIQARGEWIPGVADPASRIGSQADGKKLLDKYVGLGLKLVQADNSIEAGLFDVWLRMNSGRLKIFRSCVQWLEEFRLYQRDKKGKVALEQNDHLMDCTRYLIRSGIQNMIVMPIELMIGQQKIFNKSDEYDPLRDGM